MLGVGEGAIREETGVYGHHLLRVPRRTRQWRLTSSLTWAHKIYDILQPGVGKKPTKPVWFAKKYVQTKNFFQVWFEKVANQFFFLVWLKNLQTKNIFQLNRKKVFGLRVHQTKPKKSFNEQNFSEKKSSLRCYRQFFAESKVLQVTTFRVL